MTITKTVGQSPRFPFGLGTIPLTPAAQSLRLLASLFRESSRCRRQTLPDQNPSPVGSQIARLFCLHVFSSPFRLPIRSCSRSVMFARLSRKDWLMYLLTHQAERQFRLPFILPTLCGFAFP